MKQLQLRTENGSLAAFDFLTNAGLQLAPNSLSFAPEEGRDMKVVLPLGKVGDESDYLAADAALQAYRRLIDLYQQDMLLIDTPWLYWNTALEAEKRHFVREMRIIYPNSREASPLLRNGLAEVEVHLTVHFAGEDEDATNLATITLSARGNGKATLPDGYGATLNRISNLRIVSTGNAELEALARWKFWVGIRRPYYGFTNFTPEWDLPHSAGSIAGASVVSDATAIGGQYINCNMTSYPAYRQWRVTYLSDITSHGLDWVGSYRLLLRQRLSAANMAVSVQARWGYKNYTSAAFATVDVPGPYTPIQSGADVPTWNLMDLGSVQIPPGDFRGMLSQNPVTPPALDDAVGRFKIELWGELTDGSGNLHLDALYLVPDTNMVIVEGGQLKGEVDQVAVRTFEDDVIRAIANYQSEPYALGEAWVDTGLDVSPRAWGLPPEGGMLVFIGQSQVYNVATGPYHNNSTVLAQNFDLNFSVVPRWLSHSQS